MQNGTARSDVMERMAGHPVLRSTYSSDGEATVRGPVTVQWLRAGEPVQATAVPTCAFLFQRVRGAWGMAGTKAFRLDDGTWLATSAGKIQVETMTGGATLLLRVPMSLLSRQLASAIQGRDPVALPIRSAAKMAMELARSSLSDAEPMSASLADAVGESLVELAKLAVIEQLCDKKVESVRETVRARIRAFVQRNLVDPDLTIERIAERMQCTKRYLHKVFSEEGQTLNQYIWAQRLERCRTDLCRDELADRSITEIAFACGFSNAAHFSRSFRARFGQPPRLYRRTMRQA